MLTNWEMLSQAIKKAGLTETGLSVKVGRSHGWIHLKRIRGNDFTNGDIAKICEALNLDSTVREAIFFAKNVDLESTI